MSDNNTNNITTGGGRGKRLKCEIYRDSMQNYKKYAIPPAQLVIADVPYNVGNNFYGSNPMWYKGGDNKNGESKLAGRASYELGRSAYGFEIDRNFYQRARDEMIKDCK